MKITVTSELENQIILDVCLKDRAVELSINETPDGFYIIGHGSVIAALSDGVFVPVDVAAAK
jgi:hypothetical protein